MTATYVSVWLDALAGSHDRLSDLVGDLDAEELGSRSYCADWSIAQVLSHLGSGAEIFSRTVDATVKGEAPPSRDTFPQIWARWNAMAPREVAEEALSADGELVEKLENLGETLEELEFTLFGGIMRTDAAGLLGARLNEHALHTWDVAVALDPRARVDADAVPLLVDRLPQAMGRLAKPEGADVVLPLRVRILTTEPARAFDLDLGDAVTMTPLERPEGAPDASDGDPDGPTTVLHLPAEALLRLLYGRLDPAHSPVIEGDGQPTLDTLRKIFPGV